MPSKSDDVDDFHARFDVPVDVPFVQGDSHEKCRTSLITEEYWEYLDAIHAQDPVAAFDALIDLVYVCVGAARTWGWDFDEGWRRVHESNMSKLDPDGRPIIRDDGKILKTSPLFRPPKLDDLVRGDECTESPESSD